MRINNTRALNDYIDAIWQMKSLGIENKTGTPLLLDSQRNVPDKIKTETKFTDGKQIQTICQFTYHHDTPPLYLEIITHNNVIKRWLMTYNNDLEQWEIFIHHPEAAGITFYRFIRCDTQKSLLDPQIQYNAMIKGAGIFSCLKTKQLNWVTHNKTPIFARLEKKRMLHFHLIEQGKTLGISISLAIYGTGRLRIRYWGDGIQYEEIFINNNGIKKTQKIQVKLNTNHLTPDSNYLNMLFIHTNSKVVNQKYFSVPIRINLSTLNVIPVQSLNWTINDLSKTYAHILHFNRQGTEKNLKNVQLSIPETLSDYIQCHDNQTGYCFSLNHLDIHPGQIISDKIQVDAKLSQYRNCVAIIPVNITFPLCKADISVAYVRKITAALSPEICITIKNNDLYHNFVIQVIHWKNKLFTYKPNFKDTGLNFWPIVKPKTKKAFYFTYNKRGPLLLPLRIQDEVLICSNCNEKTAFRQNVDITFMPQVMRIFNFGLLKKKNNN
jgi:hypothetical protein